MTLIEVSDSGDSLTFQQRWSHLLTLILAGLCLFYAWNLRAGTLNATTDYVNIRAGIRASYPLNWLIDEDGDYVFRVRDMSRIGFKTTIQVQTLPIGAETTPRYLLSTVNISRSDLLLIYKPLSIEPFRFGDITDGFSMNYTFVDTETNPFLESLPTVVLGRDVLIVRGSQAIIITFLADAETFYNDLSVFNRFLSNLEFE